MRTGWGGHSPGEGYDWASTTCAKNIYRLFLHATGIVMCSSGGCIRNWYFFHWHPTPLKPTTYTAPPLALCFPATSLASFKIRELDSRLFRGGGIGLTPIIIRIPDRPARTWVTALSTTFRVGVRSTNSTYFPTSQRAANDIKKSASYRPRNHDRQRLRT